MGRPPDGRAYPPPQRSVTRPEETRLTMINVRRLLISLDLHRRTVLDCLAILMIIGGVVSLGMALGLLYPTDEHTRLPGTDVIAAGSTAAAVGGILPCLGSEAIAMIMPSIRRPVTKKKRPGEASRT